MEIKIAKEKLLITLFSIIFSVAMLRSGWFLRGGFQLVGVNNSDGIWNLALIEELKHHFPPDHPAFAGQPLKAYHFLYHLLLAVVSKVTFISYIHLYFQVFPLLISLLWGFGVYFLVKDWFSDKKSALWSVFFSFFGGSLAFIFQFLGYKELSIDSAFGISQPYSSSLVNPAFASSIVLVIWSLYFMKKYLNLGKRRHILYATIISGLSIGFKAYAGMILLGALLVLAIHRLLFFRKKDILIYFFLALVISLAVFMPFNGDYGFLVWAPLWPLHRIMQGTLNFTRWDELWHQYNTYMDYLGIIKLEIWAFLLFFFGNIGTRILFLPVIFQKVELKKLTKNSFLIYFLTAVFISSLIPMFFIQPTGGGFNIIQMYWYFLFLISLVTGAGVVIIAQKIKNKILRISFYTFVVVLTIPSSYFAFQSFLLSPGSSISKDKLELFAFLKSYKNYDQTVLEVPNLDHYRYENLDFWFNRSSLPYLPALGGKRAYIANEVVSFAYEKKEERLRKIENFMKSLNVCNEDNFSGENCQNLLQTSYQMLVRNNIRVLFIPNDERFLLLDKWDKLKVLFKNPEGKIYEVLFLR